MPDAELRAELNQVVQLAVRVTGAHLAFVALGSGDELTVAACHGDALSIDEVHEFAALVHAGFDDWTQPTTAQPTATTPPSPARLPIGLGTFLAEPLISTVATQRPFPSGMLCVVAGADHHWGGGDSAVVQRLAQLCVAQLRHHSRMTVLVAREHSTALLARYAAELATAATEAEVVAAIGAAARNLLDASAASIALCSGADLVLTELHGVEHTVAARFAVLDPSDPNPISRSVATNQPIFLRSRAALIEEFSHLADAADAGGHQAYAVAPLAESDEALGAVALMWDAPRDLLMWEGAAITELGRLGGRALWRVQSVDEAAALAAIDGDLGAAPTVAEVAEIVADRASKLLGAASVQLAVVVGDALEMVASRSMPPVEEDRYRRTPLATDYPACAAVREQRVVVIDDEAAWRQWPAAIDTRDALGAVALVALPLAQGGRVGGVLAFGFLRYGDLGIRQRRLAGRIANMAARAVERAQLLDTTRQLLERQRTIAARLQRSLLPADLPQVPGADLSAIYRPAEQDIHVGGDWYDAFLLADGRLMLTIGDVVGKGVDAAGASGQLRSAMRALADSGARAAQLVERLDWFATTFPAAWAATTMCLIADLETGDVEVCRAGHIPPLIVADDATTRYHEAGGSAPLGVGSPRSRTESTFHLGPGDLLILCTDGLVERPIVSLDVGLSELAVVASELRRSARLDDLLDRVVASVTESQQIRDDLCVLALRRHP